MRAWTRPACGLWTEHSAFVMADDAAGVEAVADVTLTDQEEKALRCLESGFKTGGACTQTESVVALDATGKELKKGEEEGIDLRGAIGQRFSRSEAGGKSQLYQAMSRDEKANFRKQWCGDELQAHTKLLREKQVSHTKTKETSMKYESGKALIKREGITAFERYAKKCASLGPPWIEWDHMWDRYVYAEVTKELKERFEQAWRVKLMDAPKDDDAAVDGADAQPASPAVATPPPKRLRLQAKTPDPEPAATGLAVGKDQGTRKDAGKDQGTGKGAGKGIGKGAAKGAGKNDDKATHANAAKTRTRIQSALGSAKHLLDVVAKSPEEWAWANTGVLQKATDTLDDFIKGDDFNQAFYLLGPSQEFKAQHKDDAHGMMVNLKKWSVEGETKCADVSKCTARLLAMNAASRKADKANEAKGGPATRA